MAGVMYKMISKHVIGRLGNQMFQYAAIRAFQIKHRPEDEILLDFSEVYSRDNEGYREELSCFNLKKVKYGKMKLSFTQKILNFNLLVIKFCVLMKNKISKSDRYNQDLYYLELNLSTYLH